jgi:hypothetical protein
MGKIVDMVGQVCGMLTVLSHSGTHALKGAYWECMCQCGKSTRVLGAALRNGGTRSCGCLRGQTLRDMRVYRCTALRLRDAERIAVPDWLKYLPDNARLNVAEVAKVFGYPSSKAVHSAVGTGKFIAPTARNTSFIINSRGFHTATNQWSAKSVRAEIKRRNAVAAELNCNSA